jgi:hypothetical protein
MRAEESDGVLRFWFPDLSAPDHARLAAHATPELRPILEHSASQARGQRDVIARFGRQPHRNALLGRRSTHEELDFLAKGDLVHTRSLPR